MEQKETLEFKRPIRTLGFFFLVGSTIPLLTYAKAFELHDIAMIWASLPVGLAWAVIGGIFVYLDYVFADKD